MTILNLIIFLIQLTLFLNAASFIKIFGLFFFCILFSFSIAVATHPHMGCDLRC